jgi:RNA polymerase sigma factor (sigma-70 family)
LSVYNCFAQDLALLPFAVSPRNGLPLPLPTSDSQLADWLAATSHGDRAAFRRLYDATSPKLFGFALRILIRGEWAEDVLQESYLSIWANARSYERSTSAPMTWMTTIVRNKAFDALRRRRELDQAGGGACQDELEALASEAPLPLEGLVMSASANALALCMKRLEALHRQAIALAFFHDLSHREVAEQLERPIGSIKTWIRRGLERLRGCLERAGES